MLLLTKTHVLQTVAAASSTTLSSAVRIAGNVFVATEYQVGRVVSHHATTEGTRVDDLASLPGSEKH